MRARERAENKNLERKRGKEDPRFNISQDLVELRAEAKVIHQEDDPEDIGADDPEAFYGSDPHLESQSILTHSEGVSSVSENDELLLRKILKLEIELDKRKKVAEENYAMRVIEEAQFESEIKEHRELIQFLTNNWPDLQFEDVTEFDRKITQFQEEENNIEQERVTENEIIGSITIKENEQNLASLRLKIVNLEGKLSNRNREIEILNTLREEKTAKFQSLIKSLEFNEGQKVVDAIELVMSRLKNKDVSYTEGLSGLQNSLEKNFEERSEVEKEKDSNQQYIKSLEDHLEFNKLMTQELEKGEEIERKLTELLEEERRLLISERGLGDEYQDFLGIYNPTLEGFNEFDNFQVMLKDALEFYQIIVFAEERVENIKKGSERENTIIEPASKIDGRLAIEIINERLKNKGELYKEKLSYLTRSLERNSQDQSSLEQVELPNKQEWEDLSKFSEKRTHVLMDDELMRKFENFPRSLASIKYKIDKKLEELSVEKKDLLISENVLKDEYQAFLRVYNPALEGFKNFGKYTIPLEDVSKFYGKAVSLEEEVKDIEQGNERDNTIIELTSIIEDGLVEKFSKDIQQLQLQRLRFQIEVLEGEVSKKDQRLAEFKMKRAVGDADLHEYIREYNELVKHIKSKRSKFSFEDTLEFAGTSSYFKDQETAIEKVIESENAIIKSIMERVSKIEGMFAEDVQIDEQQLLILPLKIEILEAELRKKNEEITIIESTTIEIQSLKDQCDTALQNLERSYKSHFQEDEMEIRVYNSSQEVMEDILQRSRDENGNFERHPIFALLDSPVELFDYIKGAEFDIISLINDPNYKDQNTEITECVKYIEKFHTSSKLLSGVSLVNKGKRRVTSKFMISNSDTALISDDEKTKGYLVVSGSDLTFTQDLVMENNDYRYYEMEFLKILFDDSLGGDKEVFNYPNFEKTNFRSCYFKDIKDFNKIADEDSIESIKITNSEFVNVDFSNMNADIFERIMLTHPGINHNTANRFTGCTLPVGLENNEDIPPEKVVIPKEKKFSQDELTLQSLRSQVEVLEAKVSEKDQELQNVLKNIEQNFEVYKSAINDYIIKVDEHIKIHNLEENIKLYSPGYGVQEIRSEIRSITQGLEDSEVFIEAEKRKISKRRENLVIEKASIIEGGFAENSQSYEQEQKHLQQKIKLLESDSDEKDQDISKLSTHNMEEFLLLQMMLNSIRYPVRSFISQGTQYYIDNARKSQEHEALRPNVRETIVSYNSYQGVMEDILKRSKDENGKFERHPIFALLDSPVELFDYIKRSAFDITSLKDDPNYKDQNTEITECVKYIEKFHTSSKLLSGVSLVNKGKRRVTSKFMISNSDTVLISDDEKTKGYLVVSGSDLTFTQDLVKEERDNSHLLPLSCAQNLVTGKIDERYYEMEFLKVLFDDSLGGDKEIFNYPNFEKTNFRSCYFKDIKDFNKIADENSIKSIKITNCEFVNVDFSNMNADIFERIMLKHPGINHNTANRFIGCTLPVRLENNEDIPPEKVVITKEPAPGVMVNIQNSDKKGNQLVGISKESDKSSSPDGGRVMGV